MRVLCVAAVGAAYGLVAGCTYVPDEANPVEWFKGARNWVGDRKTEEQEKAEATAKTLPMPNQDAPFPKLSSVPERPDRSGEPPPSTTARTLRVDRDSARTSDAAVRERDSDFVIEPPPPPRKKRVTARQKRPAPAARPPAPPRMPKRVRPPPPPDIPDLPTTGGPAATGDRSGLIERGVKPMPAVFSAPVRTSELLVRVAGRSAPPLLRTPSTDPPGRLGPFAGGVEPSPEPRARPRQRTSAPADIVPAVPRAPAATARPAAALPKNLKFGPPPTDIDPFGTSTAPAPTADRPRSTSSPRPRVSRAVVAGRDAASAVSRRTGDAAAVRRIGVVLFANGSSSVGPEGRRVLRSAVVEMRKQGGTLRIVGHASSGATGERDPVRHRMANLTMSLDRANSVARELVKLGIDPKAIVVGAMAESEPAASESTSAGAARNRRAEIYLDN